MACDFYEHIETAQSLVFAPPSAVVSSRQANTQQLHGWKVYAIRQ